MGLAVVAGTFYWPTSRFRLLGSDFAWTPPFRVMSCLFQVYFVVVASPGPQSLSNHSVKKQKGGLSEEHTSIPCHAKHKPKPSSQVLGQDEFGNK